MFTIEPEDIAAIRKDLNLSQHQFALLFGVHHMTASKWERGELKPSGYQLALMTEFEKAGKNDPHLKNLLPNMLVGSGVTNALFTLLHRARMRKPSKAKR